MNSTLKVLASKMGEDIEIKGLQVSKVGKKNDLISRGCRMYGKSYGIVIKATYISLVRLAKL